MNDCNCPAQTAPAESAATSIQRPQFRTKEDESGATVQIALPGVRKEDVKLTLHESSLKIEGHRYEEVPADWKTHRQTGAAGRYGLEIRLTSRLDGTRATAAFENGVLTLQVPVREEAKPRQIEVN